MIRTDEIVSLYSCIYISNLLSNIKIAVIIHTILLKNVFIKYMHICDNYRREICEKMIVIIFKPVER